MFSLSSTVFFEIFVYFNPGPCSLLTGEDVFPIPGKVFTFYLCYLTYFHFSECSFFTQTEQIIKAYNLNIPSKTHGGWILLSQFYKFYNSLKVRLLINGGILAPFYLISVSNFSRFDLVFLILPFHLPDSHFWSYCQSFIVESRCNIFFFEGYEISSVFLNCVYIPCFVF